MGSRKYALKGSANAYLKRNPASVPRTHFNEEGYYEGDEEIVFDLEVDGPAPRWVSTGLITPEGEDILTRVSPPIGFLDFELFYEEETD